MAGYLPQVVLVGIFSHVVGPEPKTTLAQWKSGLSLLGVNQMWRETGLPLVYRHAIARADQRPRSRRHSSPVAQTARWSTNISLIHALHASSQVRSISITLISMQDTAGALAHLQGILGSGISWGTATRLWMFVHPRHSAMDADTKDNTLIDAVQSFAQCLPNLDTLVLESALPRNIGLYQVLARQYARQLKGLVCPHAQCIAAGPGIGSQLTSLEIRVDPESTALIQKVLPAQLRRLYLHNLTSSFTWHCFDRTQQQLVFANLVTLGLHYGNSDRGNGQKVVAGRLAVHLPKLRVLQVKNLPASCQLLQYVRCHANLRALEYSGAFQGLQDLSQAGITTANTLFIELSSDGPPPPPSEFAQTTNIFLDQIGTGPEGAEAKLFCHRLDPTRFPATWTNLGKLHIHASMEFDTLLNLIPYMPRLDLLIIHRLEATTEHTEIPILDLDTYVSPLPTCVRSMTLMHSALGEPSRLLVRAIKYLVLRMPSVEFLQTNQYMHEEIKRFARSFPKWHDRPHKLTVN